MQELKNQNEKSIAELDQQIKDTEVELQKLRNQIERAEQQLIQEQNLQKGSPRSPLIIAHGEVAETPRTAERVSNKARNASVPRFMTSTVASRQRLTANEQQVNGRMRTLRIGTRSPVDLLSSQSLSYSEPSMKPNPVRSKSKLMMCETNSPTLLSRNKKVSTSHPNLRATFYQHRRRMSDLT